MVLPIAQITILSELWDSACRRSAGAITPTEGRIVKSAIQTGDANTIRLAIDTIKNDTQEVKRFRKEVGKVAEGDDDGDKRKSTLSRFIEHRQDIRKRKQDKEVVIGVWAAAKSRLKTSLTEDEYYILSKAFKSGDIRAVQKLLKHINIGDPVLDVLREELNKLYPETAESAKFREISAALDKLDAENPDDERLQYYLNTLLMWLLVALKEDGRVSSEMHEVSGRLLNKLYTLTRK